VGELAERLEQNIVFSGLRESLRLYRLAALAPQPCFTPRIIYGSHGKTA